MPVFSGCGKSTLLNALAGRLPRPGVLTGKILVNGLQPSARGHLSDIMEYVRQEDNVFFQSLTAHETLMIGAEFYYADRPATRQEVRAIIWLSDPAEASDMAL